MFLILQQYDLNDRQCFVLWLCIICADEKGCSSGVGYRNTASAMVINARVEALSSCTVSIKPWVQLKGQVVAFRWWCVTRYLISHYRLYFDQRFCMNRRQIAHYRIYFDQWLCVNRCQLSHGRASFHLTHRAQFCWIRGLALYILIKVRSDCVSVSAFISNMT